MSELLSDATIAACATAQGTGGIAVIRISGPATRQVLGKLVERSQPIIENPRVACYRTFFDPYSREKLDSGLVLFFEGRASFTGEDSAELHCHGSPLIIGRVLRALFSCGCQPAQPGEFSRRAYLNGKLDLIQAEAISDLITATSERALRLASEQLEGKLSSVISELGEPLRDILAEIEASLDFPDEDITPDSRASLARQLEVIRTTCATLLTSYDTGRKIRDGFRIVLWGLPNSGKSSLLNALLGEDRAIVTEVSGTTRDTLEEELVIDGSACIICDTAGINESHDIVEKIGIERARKRLSWADLVLFLVDSSQAAKQVGEIRQLEEELQQLSIPVWLICNKVDKVPLPSPLLEGAQGSLYQKAFTISAKRGDGIPELRDALKQASHYWTQGDSDAGNIITNERHRAQLEASLVHMETAKAALFSGVPFEMVSEDLKAALHALEELIGVTSSDDILGRIFSKFCIGK